MAAHHPLINILMPEIDEDGRVSYWEEVTDGELANHFLLTTLACVGNRVDWAWPQVVELVKACHLNPSMAVNPTITALNPGSACILQAECGILPNSLPLPLQSPISNLQSPISNLQSPISNPSLSEKPQHITATKHIT